jgi:hypothetical protein
MNTWSAHVAILRLTLHFIRTLPTSNSADEQVSNNLEGTPFLLCIRRLAPCNRSSPSRRGGSHLAEQPDKKSHPRSSGRVYQLEERPPSRLRHLLIRHPGQGRSTGLRTDRLPHGELLVVRSTKVLHGPGQTTTF